MASKRQRNRKRRQRNNETKRITEQKKPAEQVNEGESNMDNSSDNEKPKRFSIRRIREAIAEKVAAVKTALKKARTWLLKEKKVKNWKIVYAKVTFGVMTACMVGYWMLYYSANKQRVQAVEVMRDQNDLLKEVNKIFRALNSWFDAKEGLLDEFRDYWQGLSE